MTGLFTFWAVETYINDLRPFVRQMKIMAIILLEYYGYNESS